MTSNIDYSTGVLAHVLGILIGFIGPLIIYFIAKDSYSKENAKKALNWQLSVIIYITVVTFLAVIFAITLNMFIAIVASILLFVVIITLDLIFCIIAAVKANAGKIWNYPLTIPFLK